MKTTWAKAWAVVLLLAALALPASALADGPVLLVQLPQDAQMVENVAFDDGDFIQTYQLSGSANIQLLRYQAFDMTIDDLVASEWIGCTDVRDLGIDQIAGYPARGLRLYVEESEALDVTIITVDAEGSTLVFEAVYPASLGSEQIGANVQNMIRSMSVMIEGAGTDENAEVG